LLSKYRKRNVIIKEERSKESEEIEESEQSREVEKLDEEISPKVLAKPT